MQSALFPYPSRSSVGALRYASGVKLVSFYVQHTVLPRISTMMSLAFTSCLGVSNWVPRTNSACVSFRQRTSLRAPARRARWMATASTPPPSPDSDRDGRSDDGSRDSEFNVEEAEEENELFRFVKAVPPPELVQRFTKAAPPVVQGAIRQTLVRMLGSLPPVAFSTSVETMSSNLVQLFHSCLISGYMFRNAAYRLELTRSLERSDLPALPAREATPEIKGGVAVFQNEDGTEFEVPVEKYVEELRSTVSSLRNELARERKGGNELLSFVATMEPKNLEALTANAGEEVIDAMRKVVDAVTTSQGLNTQEDKLVHASTLELGQLLFYLMVNGFFLREAEVRVELQRQLGGDVASDLNKLLEGGSPSE